MSEVPFYITGAGWQDLLSVLRLEKACFDRDAWPWTEILGVLMVPGVVRLKAVCPGGLVGFVAGDRVEHGLLGRILTLGVLPENRRRGIGQALLYETEQRMGTPRLQLVLRRSNNGALDLYRRSGYQVVDSWPGYYRDGEDGLVMEKSTSL